MPMPMQVVPPVDLCIRWLGYYSYGPIWLPSADYSVVLLEFLTPHIRCVNQNVTKLTWRWWHGSVMGVTGAGDGASAPLPPDGHIPPPASSSDPAQQFRHSFLAQSIFSVTQYTLQDVGALYDKCLIYFSAKVGCGLMVLKIEMNLFWCIINNMKACQKFNERLKVKFLDKWWMVNHSLEKYSHHWYFSKLYFSKLYFYNLYFSKLYFLNCIFPSGIFLNCIIPNLLTFY